MASRAVPDDVVVRNMPKVELHAHLNGCISDHLLQHLTTFNERLATPEKLPHIDEDGVLMDFEHFKSEGHAYDICNSDKGLLAECFQVFGKIHQVIRTPATVYAATVNVIAEFVLDNVIYLELRTGPKRIHSIPSKLSYAEAVVKGIKDAQKRFPITVRLLISVDRKCGEQEGFHTVELASSLAKQHPDVVVGLDVSGDPNCGHADWIVRLMQEARRNGLKTSCHLSEIGNLEETLAFMRFAPERVGHGQFLHPDYGGTNELWQLAREKRIPVESCITSNLITGVTTALEEHVVCKFQQDSIPYVICTDDSGVFGTTLSKEFLKLLSVVPLNLEQLEQLSLTAIVHAFATDAVKAEVQEKIKKWWKQEYLHRESLTC